MRTPYPSWQCEIEGSTFSQITLNPDPSLMPCHDLAANGEPHPAPRVLIPRMQAFENPEYFLRILGLYANSVVLHRKQPFVVSRFRGDVDLRRLLTTVPDGIHQ